MAVQRDNTATTDYLTTESSGRKITTTISAKGARRMTRMMIEAYSDNSVAIAREYIANAVDATI